MKKKVFGRKLSRERDTRRALFRALIRALVEYGKITTTKAKAKAIQGRIDKLVNLAKGGSIHSNRRLFAALGNDKVTGKAILKKVVPSFSDRKSGYTRIIKLNRRKGDAAEMVRLEWVKEVLEPTKKPEVKTKKKESTKKKTKEVKKK